MDATVTKTPYRIVICFDDKGGLGDIYCSYWRTVVVDGETVANGETSQELLLLDGVAGIIDRLAKPAAKAVTALAQVQDDAIAAQIEPEPVLDLAPAVDAQG